MIKAKANTASPNRSKKGYTISWGGIILLQNSVSPNPPIVWDTKCCRKIMYPPKDQRRGYTILQDTLFRVTPKLEQPV